MAIDYANKLPLNQPVNDAEPLHCALTGVPVSAETAYWAPPLVTAGELVRAITSGLLHSPGTLSRILFDEQAKVPYDPAVREQLAARRSAEQLTLLVGVLVLVALVVVPIVLLALR